jgi:hypothetical protein
VYQDRAARDAQNAEMLVQCLKASISRKGDSKPSSRVDVLR